MKTASKILAAIATVLLLVTAASCAKYDDDINDLRSRLSQIESQLNGLKSNISGLQTAVAALQNNVFVTSVTESADGWVIKFSNGKTAELHNGVSPVIAVKQGEDSRWYWTVNGEWLKDSGGNRVPTTGADGTNGTNGVTPQMKIEGDYWYVSVDNGANWTQVGKAKGADGDAFFSSVTYNDHSVTLTLKDGTPIVLGRGANGVQAIQVVPDYSDGSVIGKPGPFNLRFDIIPTRATASVAALANECFTVNAVYTITKAAAGDVIPLPVTAKSVDDGKLILTIDGTELNLFYGQYSAGIVPQIGINAALVIDDGTNAVTSSYFQICNTQEVTRSYEGVYMGYGLYWATKNLGADRPEDTGLMLGWAETRPSTDYYWASYTWMQAGASDEKHITKYTFADGHTDAIWYNGSEFIGDGKTKLSDYDYADDPARQLWGGYWRVPTPDDWAKLMDPTDYSWVWDANRLGFVVTSNLTDSSAGNRIFLPATGTIFLLQWYQRGTHGFYWTNELSTSDSYSAQYLDCAKDGTKVLGNLLRAYPLAIRPVRN